jgi:7-cyano-7-deazaguanine synthase
MEDKQAILFLSGGIDSTTLLAKLSSDNYELIALSFQYGQKHGIELNYAKKNAEIYGVKNITSLSWANCFSNHQRW